MATPLKRLKEIQSTGHEEHSEGSQHPSKCKVVNPATQALGPSPSDSGLGNTSNDASHAAQLQDNTNKSILRTATATMKDFTAEIRSNLRRTHGSPSATAHPQAATNSYAKRLLSSFSIEGAISSVLGLMALLGLAYFVSYMVPVTVRRLAAMLPGALFSLVIGIVRGTRQGLSEVWHGLANEFRAVQLPALASMCETGASAVLFTMKTVLEYLPFTGGPHAETITGPELATPTIFLQCPQASRVLVEQEEMRQPAFGKGRTYITDAEGRTYITDFVGRAEYLSRKKVLTRLMKLDGSLRNMLRDALKTQNQSIHAMDRKVTEQFSLTAKSTRDEQESWWRWYETGISRDPRKVAKEFTKRLKRSMRKIDMIQEELRHHQARVKLREVANNACLEEDIFGEEMNNLIREASAEDTKKKQATAGAGKQDTTGPSDRTDISVSVTGRTLIKNNILCDAVWEDVHRLDGFIKHLFDDKSRLEKLHASVTDIMRDRLSDDASTPEVVKAMEMLKGLLKEWHMRVNSWYAA
jgi:hypothetical protein